MNAKSPPAATADAALIADLFSGALEELSLLRAIARAALDVRGEVKATKRGVEAAAVLGDALVAYNGAPLMFRGRLNDDGPDYRAELAKYGRTDPAFGATAEALDLFAPVPGLPWLVTDEETRPGATPLKRFASEDEAAAWIDTQPDRAKIERGGYGLEGPADDNEEEA